MFSAARIGFDYYAGPTITDGRLTTVVAPAVFTGSYAGWNVSNYVDDSNNFYVINTGTNSTSSSTGFNIVKMAAAGTLSYSRQIYGANSTSPINWYSCVVNNSTGDIYIVGIATISATSSNYLLKLSSTGTSTTSIGFRYSSTLSLATPMIALSTTSNYVYVAGGNNYVARSTSLTNLTPTWIYLLAITGGTSLALRACMVTPGNKFIASGSYIDASSRRNIVMFDYGSGGTGAAPTGLALYKDATNYPTVGTISNNTIAFNGTDMYVAGGYVSSVTNLALYKFSVSGATPTFTWASVLNSAVTNTVGAVIIDGNGNILVSSFSTASPTTIWITSFNSSGSLLWQNSIILSGTGFGSVGGISAHAIQADSSYFYLDAMYSYSGTTTAFGLNYKLPLDGTIPGTGTYTITSPATGTVTYASVAATLQAVTFNTQSPGTITSTSQTITTAAYTPNNASSTPTTTTQTI